MQLQHQEKLRICGYRIPTYFWFMLSGAICDVIQAVFDFVIYKYISNWESLKYERATICWTLSYTLSIVFRHYSHRILVFGEFEGSYCQSLMRTYLAYSSSIVISMLCNHWLTEFIGLGHLEAWIITMLWTGIVNYFILKASWRSTPAVEAVKTTIDVV